MRFTSLLVILLVASLAHADIVARREEGPPIYVPAARTSLFSRIAKRFSSPLWNITYDPYVPSSAVRAAVEYATDIIGKYFVINFPIRAQFSFRSLGESAQGLQILGQARSAVWWPMLDSNGRFQSVPIALANTKAGSDELVSMSERIDIIATFNTDAPFYFASDGSKPPSGQFDFVTVLIHELLHGMGFVGGFSCKNPCNPDFPELQVPYVFRDYLPSYDERIVNEEGESMASTFRNKGSVGMAEFYAHSRRLYLRTDDQAEPQVELFIPHPYLAGNAIYHLGERYSGGGDALMRYAVASGDVIHALGPSTLRVMQAVGWDLQPGALSSTSASLAYTPSLLLLLGLLLSLELYYLYLA